MWKIYFIHNHDSTYILHTEQAYTMCVWKWINAPNIDTANTLVSCG